jgi:hypothetical protein
MKATEVVGWLIPVVFLGLAAALLSGRQTPDIPVAPLRDVDRSLFEARPWREAKTRPVYAVAGLEMHCSSCHRLFDSREFVSASRLAQHTEIVHDHIPGNRCFDCHDNESRDRLRLITGELLEFSESERLCAQCHGPLYRDWQRGTHGKRFGSWMEANGERLSCLQCHDPHSPAFGQMSLLPGPRTLRMGEQPSESRRTEGAHSPLLRGAERAAEAEGEGAQDDHANRKED